MNYDENHLKEFFNHCAIELEPKPKYFKRIFMAFLIGGLFCVVGEFLFKIYGKTSLDELQVRALGSITMIFIGSFLTGVGVYDKIGNIAGAGSIVPITGFANSMTSPAIVFGTCVKMFTIAGSVIVFGISSSVLVGLIHFLCNKISN